MNPLEEMKLNVKELEDTINRIDAIPVKMDRGSWLIYAVISAIAFLLGSLITKIF